MTILIKILASTATVLMLSGCVTQSYENNQDTPVIENSASNNEMAMTRISLGMGYLKMGNTTQAKINLEKAKRFAPNLTQVHTAFAHYYDTVEEVDLAIASYEKALTLDGNDADTLNNYGVFLCRQQRFDDAEKQILKAIAVPSYVLVSQSYENLALCQLKANNFDKAQTYFEKSISHNPGSASGLLQMVRLQYAMANYKKAQTFLQRYEKSTRRFTANALSLAFKVFEKQRNNKVAKNYAGMLVKMFPNSYEAKQYILNGLYRIEADELAEKYQLSQISSAQKKSKKRRIVLSPKSKATVLSASNKKTVISKAPNVVTGKVDTKDSLASSKPQQIETSTTSALMTKNRTDDKTAAAVKAKTQKMLTLPIHIIKKGDSLFSISRKYNIRMGSIQHWNHLKKSAILRIGDVIYLANPKKMAKSK